MSDPVEELRRQLDDMLCNVKLTRAQVVKLQRMASDGQLQSLGFRWVQFRPYNTLASEWQLFRAQSANDIAATKDYFWGTGRRKTAVARVRVSVGNGHVQVNGRSLNDHFTNERDRKAIFEPLEVASMAGRVDVHIKVRGGGLTGQAGAAVMGIARAIVKLHPESEKAVRAASLLTRDSRMKERKKYGQRGARRRFQFSKR